MRKLFIAFLIFATVLTVLFLWNEVDKLSLHKVINSEKFGNYFTALGAVAAAISIYFLYGQLLEMKETRQAAYQPDLYPEASKFQVKDIKDYEYNSINLPQSIIQRLENNQPQESFRPYIQLYNIGLGAAKNILATWKYNSNDIEQLIKDVYKGYKGTDSESEHFDFLQANGKTTLKIPLYYFNCCGIQLNQDLLDLITPINEKSKPELKLHIKFQDIQNNWIEKTFVVGVEAYNNSVDLNFSALT